MNLFPIIILFLFFSIDIVTTQSHNASNKVLQGNESIPSFLYILIIGDGISRDLFHNLHKPNGKTLAEPQKPNPVLLQLNGRKTAEVLPKRNLPFFDIVKLRRDGLRGLISNKSKRLFQLFPQRRRWKRDANFNLRIAEVVNHAKANSKNVLWQKAALTKSGLNQRKGSVLGYRRKKRQTRFKHVVAVWTTGEEPAPVTGDDSVDLEELANARDDLENMAETETEKPGFPIDELKQLSENKYAPALSVYEVKPLDRQKMWHEWGDWSPCSSSCGEGWMTRQRRCLSGHCEENEMEVLQEPCNVGECPSD